MGNVLNYGAVKECFENNGCELLEKEYKNNRTKLWFICNCGRKYGRRFDSFKKSPWCRKCGYDRAALAKAYSQDEVKAFFVQQNCELLEEYRNCHSAMQYKCDCGNIAFITFANFRKGRRCKQCGIRKTIGVEHWRWIADREKVALDKLFRKKCYKALSTTLKCVYRVKEKHTKEILGYSPSELQDYVTNHPNWNNVKDYKWHLDHIFPTQAFIDFGIVDIKLINCLENLQPILNCDNLSKGDKYDKIKFKEWLSKHGIN
jgi:hypothetical protein